MIPEISLVFLIDKNDALLYFLYNFDKDEKPE